MSREIDPENMTADDVEYVRQRPFLRREFIMQGLGDPLDPDYPGLVGGEPQETDEERELREAQEKREQEERELAEAREREEQARVAAEEAEADAANAEADELRKSEAAEAEAAAADAGDPAFEQLEESKQWNPSMKKAALEAVIEARNADYDEDEKIVVEGEGTKADLVRALEQDDRELAGEE
jgi:hypothetical protein